MDEKLQQDTQQRTSRRRNSGPTISDVARRAGVSLMTVSRVINEANVLAATRERVEKAIEELGYVPNPAARSLAGGKQCRVALVYNNPSTAYLSEFLVGSLSGAEQNDLQLTVENWNGIEPVDALVQRFASRRINGVLLPPPLCEHVGLLDALRMARIPVAQVATPEPRTGNFAVMLGDEEAAHAMTSHLIELGHERIGFIVGNPDQRVSSHRLAGYRCAIKEAGIKADPKLVVQGDFTYRSGLIAAERLLSLALPPTAIFASNDDMAAAVIAVAHRRHLDVPSDLSVCGYDDTAMATSVWPEITTIRQPIAEMARQATGLLAEALRSGVKGQKPEHRQLSYEVVQRGSTAQKSPRN